MKKWLLFLWFATTAVFAQSGLFYDDFETYAIGDWAEGSLHGEWQVIFNGYGTVGVMTDSSKSTNAQVHFQRPKESTAPNETHASLVVSRFTVGDFDLELDVKTVKPLRTPTPNPWEAAWVLWHYTDNTHFYYFILKPNGWELGKEDPAYPGSQRFLATGSEPRLVVGQYNRFQIQQRQNAFNVSIDGRPVISFLDLERPYLSGKIGLYNEDAFVYFDSIAVRSGSILRVGENPVHSSDDYLIVQNYPNPFNSATTIAYRLPRSTPVRLEIFGLDGKRLSVLVNERQKSGLHRVVWNATEHPSGLYFYRLWTPWDFRVGKLLLVR